jgi:hypothetical protein
MTAFFVVTAAMSSRPANSSSQLLRAEIAPRHNSLRGNLKERLLHGDLSYVDQMFNLTTVTPGKFFNTNCDVVDYSMAHTLSYLVAGLND